MRPGPSSAAPGLRVSASAFTLIELVISAALMALILVSAYLCLSSGLASRKLIESRAEVVQSARVAMTRLTADLRGACPLSRDIAFLGMQRMLGEVEADNLDFATHNYIPHRSREGDFCAVSYFLGKEPESGKLSLWRRRNPTIPLEPLSKTPPNLEGLPDAVRITLWFGLGSASPPKNPPEQTPSEPTLAFQTVCRLNLAGISLRKTASAPGNNANSANQPGQAAPNGGRQ